LVFILLGNDTGEITDCASNGTFINVTTQVMCCCPAKCCLLIHHSQLPLLLWAFNRK